MTAGLQVEIVRRWPEGIEMGGRHIEGVCSSMQVYLEYVMLGGCQEYCRE